MAAGRFRLYPPGNPQRRPPVGLPLTLAPKHMQWMEGQKQSSGTALPAYTVEVILAVSREPVLKRQLQPLKTLAARYASFTPQEWEGAANEWSSAVHVFALACLVTSTAPIHHHILLLLAALANSRPDLPVLEWLHGATFNAFQGDFPFVRPAGAVLALSCVAQQKEGQVGKAWVERCGPEAVACVGRWLGSDGPAQGTPQDTKDMLLGLGALLRMAVQVPASSRAELLTGLARTVCSPQHGGDVALLAAQGLSLCPGTPTEGMPPALALAEGEQAHYGDIVVGPLGSRIMGRASMARGLLLEMSLEQLAAWPPAGPCVLMRLCGPLLEAASAPDGSQRVAGLQGLALWMDLVNRSVQSAVDGGREDERTRWGAVLGGADGLGLQLVDVLGRTWLGPETLAPSQGRSILQGLLVATQAIGQDMASALPLGRVLGLDWGLRAKYDCLTLLLPATGAKILLENCPGLAGCLVGAMVDAQPGLAHEMATFVGAFNRKWVEELQRDGSTDPARAVVQVWAGALCALNCDSNATLSLLQILVPVLLPLGPNTVHVLLSTFLPSTHTHTQSAVLVVGTLSTLPPSPQHPHTLLFGNNDTWPLGSDVTRESILSPVQQALVHGSPCVVLAAMRLICCAPKATTAISEEEARLMRWALLHNMHSESASFRHDCVSLVRQAIARARCSTRAGNDAHGPTFVSSLLALAQSNLGLGVPHAPASMALALLQVLETEWGLGTMTAPALAPLLLGCVGSQQGDIRQNAYQLLCNLKHAAHGMSSPDVLFDTAWPLLNSPRANDADTGALLVRLVNRQGEVGVQYVPNNDNNGTGRLTVGPVKGGAVGTLQALLGLVGAHIDVARASLLQAAHIAPMHGPIRAVAYVVGDLPAEDLSRPGLGEVLSQAVGCIFTALDLVYPVISDPSPEGNLPADVIAQYVALGGRAEAGPLHQVGLACCWQVVQACSMLVASMLRCVQTDTLAKLVGVDVLSRLGERYLSLLLDTVHVGAYEQAKVGFESLFASWATCGETELKSAPLRWVERTLEAVEGKTSTTRRSAGLPFVAVCAGLHLGAAHGFDMQGLLVRLMEIAQRPIPADATAMHTTTLPQVHALAMLRALCRDARLASSICSQVETLLLGTMTVYQSSNWAVRSAATMLLGPLLARIFGPPPAGSGGWAQGSISGRRFFQDYPLLHGAMLSALADGSTALPPSLYPALAILARLLPSSQSDDGLLLSPTALQPGVLSCGGSAIHMTRQMSAHALVPLAPLPDVPTLLATLLDTVSNRHTPTNHVHGCLLQVQALLRAHTLKTGGGGSPSPLRDQLVGVAAEGLGLCLWRLEARCALVGALVLDLATALIMDGPSPPCPAVSTLCTLLDPHLDTLLDPYLHSNPPTTPPTTIGWAPLAGAAARCSLALSSYRVGLGLAGPDLWGQIVAFLGSWCSNLQIAGLETATESLTAQALPDQVISLVVDLVNSRPAPPPLVLHACMVLLHNMSTHGHRIPTPDAAGRLLASLRNMVEGGHGNQRAAEQAVAVAGMLLDDGTKKEEFDWWLVTWADRARDEQPMDMRAAVVAGMSACKVLPGEGEDSMGAWGLLLGLLQDDDGDVRQAACELASGWLKRAGYTTVPIEQEVHALWACVAHLVQMSPQMGPDTVFTYITNTLCPPSASVLPQPSNLLFEAEAPNQHRHTLAWIQLLSKALTTLIATRPPPANAINQAARSAVNTVKQMGKTFFNSPISPVMFQQMYGPLTLLVVLKPHFAPYEDTELAPVLEVLVDPRQPPHVQTLVLTLQGRKEEEEGRMLVPDVPWPAIG